MSGSSAPSAPRAADVREPVPDGPAGVRELAARDHPLDHRHRWRAVCAGTIAWSPSDAVCRGIVSRDRAGRRRGIRSGVVLWAHPRIQPEYRRSTGLWHDDASHGTLRYAVRRANADVTVNLRGAMRRSLVWGTVALLAVACGDGAGPGTSYVLTIVSGNAQVDTISWTL